MAICEKQFGFNNVFCLRVEIESEIRVRTSTFHIIVHALHVKFMVLGHESCLQIINHTVRAVLVTYCIHKLKEYQF